MVNLWILMALGITLLLSLTLRWPMTRSIWTLILVGAAFAVLTRLVVSQEQQLDVVVSLVALTLVAIAFIVLERARKRSKD